MFLLRIAGDVLGQKRNIEVIFPRRPSLQQICTVAEAILPLQGRDDRRPWRPPGPLNSSAPPASSPASPSADRSPQHCRGCSPVASDYIVEALAFMNPTTRRWEELYSASQLSSGAQVYGFCPLQRHCVAFVRPRARVGHIPPSLLERLPVVTKVREHWVNADRPGAIPEPQQRLVWDCATLSRSPRRRDGGRQGVQPYFSDASADNSRNLGHGQDDTCATSFSAPRVPSSGSPSVIQPSNCYYYNDPCALDTSNVPTGSFRRSAKRLMESSAAAQGNTTSYNHACSAYSTLLLSGGGDGDGGDRYAHLGERLALLFDVLVHLDAQESGTERHYLLLRDFYLLSSYLASSFIGTAGRGGGSAVPPDPVDLTAELMTRFRLSWDDVLRTADKDRDGCIAYREWIAFGIEQPDVVQLLCQAVRRLPRHVNASIKRLGMQTTSQLASHSRSPVSPSMSNHDMETVPSNTSLTSAACSCRIHRRRSSERVQSVAAAAPATQDDRAFYEGRCEACRELAARSPEERLQWAAKPTAFVNTLRQ
ncbi:hypothetical protein N2W54_000271 [Lotmaria passim]